MRLVFAALRPPRLSVLLILAVEEARGYAITRDALVQALHRADRARRIQKWAPQSPARRLSAAFCRQTLNYESDPNESSNEQDVNPTNEPNEEPVAEEFDVAMLERMQKLEQASRPRDSSARHANGRILQTLYAGENASNVNLSTLGKIDLVSKTKSRRQRRKVLEKKFDVMKRGPVLGNQRNAKLLKQILISA